MQGRSSAQSSVHTLSTDAGTITNGRPVSPKPLIALDDSQEAWWNEQRGSEVLLLIAIQPVYALPDKLVFTLTNTLTERFP
jgi:hypothetical protein